MLGNEIIVIPLTVILSLTLLLYRRHGEAIALWGLMIVTYALTALGKNYFLRPRPDGSDQASFPSGHASATIALYGFMAYLLLRSGVSQSKRLLIITVTAVLVLLVDVSRMVLGKHFLTDVLAGNALGLSVLLLVIAVWEWWEARAL